MLSDLTFPDIPDSNHFPLPSNCALRQAAIQQVKVVPHDKKYLINKDVWDYLDENQRAVLVLHEIVYGEALRHGHETSQKSRYFGSLLFSDEIQKMDESAYERIVKMMNFDRILFRDEQEGFDWEFSDKKMSYQDAIEFCHTRAFSVFHRERLTTRALSNLKKSFIGKYYMDLSDGLQTWGWHEDGEAPYVVKIDGDQEKASAPEGDVYPVLCFQPN